MRFFFFSAAVGFGVGFESGPVWGVVAGFALAAICDAVGAE